MYDLRLVCHEYFVCGNFEWCDHNRNSTILFKVEFYFTKSDVNGNKIYFLISILPLTSGFYNKIKRPGRGDPKSHEHVEVIDKLEIDLWVAKTLYNRTINYSDCKLIN